jgi:hypothetical protein
MLKVSITLTFCVVEALPVSIDLVLRSRAERYGQRHKRSPANFMQNIHPTYHIKARPLTTSLLLLYRGTR